MRVTTNQLEKIFLDNLGKTRNTVTKLQAKMAAQSNVLKPSDSPLATARIARLKNQLSDYDIYERNLENAQTRLSATLQAMEGMGDEIQKVLSDLTEVRNPINFSLSENYAAKIDQAIQNMLTYMNTQVDGTYLFAGTNTATAPYSSPTEVPGAGSLGKNLSGEHKVKIGPGIEQKINITGTELFQPMFDLGGSLNINEEIGTETTFTKSFLNSSGIEYNLKLTFQKTDEGLYSVRTEVLSPGGTTVTAANATLQFDPNSGVLKTQDGNPASPITLTSATDEISIQVFLGNATLSENHALRGEFNQDSNILDVLKGIKDSLKAGIQPTDNQIKMVQNFSSLLLRKTTEAGGMLNKVNAISDMLPDQKMQVQSLLSKESDLDVAKAVIEMQSAQYSLDMMYKTSSMLLPKSLIDFL